MKNKTGRVSFQRELLESKAYLSLSGAAPQVLGLFYCKRCFKKMRRKEYISVNDGELILTYREAAELGVGRDRFTRAVANLVEHGFLDIIHQGGGMEGDANIFALSDRWRNYGKPSFQKSIRQKDSRRIGFCDMKISAKGRNAISNKKNQHVKTRQVADAKTREVGENDNGNHAGFHVRSDIDTFDSTLAGTTN